MNDTSCKKCGSNKIIKSLSIVDHGHMNEKKHLSIHIQTTDQMFFNKFEKEKLKAQVCGSCGKVELYVENPEELWQAFQKHKAL